MGIPLPPELYGQTVTRCLTLDAALWYLVIGALVYLPETDLQETGALDVETVRALLQTAIDELNEAQ